MKNLTLLLSTLLLIASCSTTPLKPKNGRWLFTLDMTSSTLPFYVELNTSDSSAVIINDTERIDVEDVILDKDSIHIYLPYFNSSFHGKVWKHDLIIGHWHNKAKSKDYKIPFRARHTKQKFTLQETNIKLHNKYAVTFGTKEDSYPAIALLEQKKNKVTGTFLTETGDYRFLDGYLDNDSLFLHAFDGAHAFTFKAIVKDDSLVNGVFYSGNHYSDVWEATTNDTMELASPYSLTYLKDPTDTFTFSFPDLHGKQTSLQDTKFQNKVKIVQVMGTWCPNCMDETKYYAELYEKYKDKGLEIIALAYERDTNFTNIVSRINLYKKQTKANYTFLVAGKANKRLTSESLPQLNKIISYPTSIFIDKNGKVLKIHTGFYGPSTGEKYTLFKQETEQLIESIL